MFPVTTALIKLIPHRIALWNHILNVAAHAQNCTFSSPPRIPISSEIVDMGFFSYAVAVNKIFNYELIKINIAKYSYMTKYLKQVEFMYSIN